DSGSGNTSLLQNPTHTFAASGSYNVTLTSSNAGGSSTKTRAGLVGGAPSKPVASFSFSPANPTPGATVAFTDGSTNAPQDWSWDFGDPASGFFNTSNVQNPQHQFSGPGSYTVTLVSINAFGSSDPATQTVTVSNCQPDGHTLC